MTLVLDLFHLSTMVLAGGVVPVLLFAQAAVIDIHGSGCFYFRINGLEKQGVRNYIEFKNTPMFTGLSVIPSNEF